MIRALFFDAAGTLIEPAEPVADVYARIATAAGFPLESAAIRGAFHEVFTGMGDPEWAAHPDGDSAEREWWRRVVHLTLSRAGGKPPRGDRFGTCFEALFAHYADPAAWTIFPEVREILQLVRDAGFLTAVVSNFDLRLHRILEGHGLSFDAVVTSAAARSRKPDPAIFREALRLTGIAPVEALHTGDSARADLHGADAAGIRCFLLDRPRTGLRDFLTWAGIRQK